MKVTGDWLDRAATQTVMTMLTGAGFQAYLVGGCVRNALLGAPVDDIDISTDALPQQVMQLADEAGLKPVPTGFDHGTVTVVADQIPHEITTFRADVATDGRRAVVKFSKELAEDARRRDFTMNALYARADGAIVDPLSGLPDLAQRRIRFIEDPDRRIREDYLRSLRFFRFFAWYGDPGAGLDTGALNAIARNLDGLDMLSRERVGKEILKLLSAPDPAPALAAMEHSGVLNRVLPGASARSLALLIHLEESTETAPDPLRRLACLGTISPGALRLSKAQARHLDVLRNGIENMHLAAQLGYLHGADLAGDILLLRGALLEMPPNPTEFDAARRGAKAVFPVKASDLAPRFEGRALGEALKRLEHAWIASDFDLTRDALLSLA